jgi:hypothetical protein
MFFCALMRYHHTQLLHLDSRIRAMVAAKGYASEHNANMFNHHATEFDKAQANAIGYASIDPIAPCTIDRGMI